MFAILFHLQITSNAKHGCRKISLKAKQMAEIWDVNSVVFILDCQQQNCQGLTFYNILLRLSQVTGTSS